MFSDIVFDNKNSFDDVWQYISYAASVSRPIVVYGMGNGADLLFDHCNSLNIPISDVAASDDFVRGQSFRGFRVKCLAEIDRLHKTPLILMAFGVHNHFMQDIYRITHTHEFLFPELPVAGKEIFDSSFVRKNAGLFDRAYEMLADEESRSVFLGICRFKLYGKLDILPIITTSKKSAYEDFVKPGADDIYMDIGAYTGDTVLETVRESGGSIGKIIAVEPDPKTFKRLCANIAEAGLQNCVCINEGAWCGKCTMEFSFSGNRGSRIIYDNRVAVGDPESDGMADSHAQKHVPHNNIFNRKPNLSVSFSSPDTILAENGGRCTIVKYDTEGAEYQALCGSKSLLCSCHPRLIISAYHRSSDLFSLPLLLDSICPGYRIYMRHHPSIPSWDTNIYAVY